MTKLTADVWLPLNPTAADVADALTKFKRIMKRAGLVDNYVQHLEYEKPSRRKTRKRKTAQALRSRMLHTQGHTQ